MATMSTLWHRHASDVSGFWGTPTATMDWCEENYAVSFYLAEFCTHSFTCTICVCVGNATTNFLFLYAGISEAMRLKRMGISGRFVVAYLMLALIGLGSMLFHGTLRYEWQLLDEVPMLFIICHFIYCLYDNKYFLDIFLGISVIGTNCGSRSAFLQSPRGCTIGLEIR